MKARVKATGKIVEVELRTFTSVRGTPITRYVDIDTEEIYVQDDLEILPPNEENSLSDPDYWTRLEHQAAIAAIEPENYAMVGNSYAWICPEGYVFKDENGNVINATKIVLEKKKKEYPKIYEECCKIMDIDTGFLLTSYDLDFWKGHLLTSLQKLLICRDAYWKIAGEEMGLGKPWEPSDSDYITGRYCIFVHKGNIICDTPVQDCVLTFPTEEMRDAFKENFDPDIEFCKELL